MKFFGTPNMLVKERKRKPFSTEYKLVPILRFNENGEYETDDPKLIEKLKRKVKTEQPKIENKIYNCKHCEYTTEDRVKLMQHYKTHKLEVKNEK